MILWFSKDRMHPGPFRDRRTWSVILKGKYWISKACGVICKRSRNVSTNWRQACDIQRRLYHLLKIKRRAHESMNLKGQSLIFANWRSQTSRPSTTKNKTSTRTRTSDSQALGLYAKSVEFRKLYHTCTGHSVAINQDNKGRGEEREVNKDINTIVAHWRESS